MSAHITRCGRIVLNLVLWAITLFVFPIPPTLLARSFQVEVLQRITFAALPQEPRLELDLDLTARVATRLVEAEFREPDAWYREDYRIARVTLGTARAGSSIPHVEATYQVLGCHPDQVWPRIEARRQALLAAEYHSIFGGTPSPKKPAQSVRLARFGQQTNAA